MNQHNLAMNEDATQYEIEALKSKYNFADGHARQTSSLSQKTIIEAFPEIWQEAERISPHEAEQELTRAFFAARQQPTACKRRSMLTFSTSVSTAIIATYLSKNNMSVGLMEPCFDNIYDLLAHSNVPVTPVAEEWLHDSTQVYNTLTAHVSHVNALIIIDPNNPTGHTLFSKNDSTCRELMRFAKDNNILLIFDFCFSHFVVIESKVQVTDAYKMLDDSGVEYITMEDTGKTWPTQELKAAIITCGPSLYEEIYRIYSSYILNVSPFLLRILTKYIQDAHAENFKSLRQLMDTNRSIVKRELARSLLEIMPQTTDLSLVWCKIARSKLDSIALQKLLGELGIYILSGHYFFWDTPKKGEAFVRIALARDTAVLEQGMLHLRKALDEVEERYS